MAKSYKNTRNHKEVYISNLHFGKSLFHIALVSSISFLDWIHNLKFGGKLLYRFLILSFLSGCNFHGEESASFTNSLGMEMVRIHPGSFRMGNEGEIDYSKLVPDARHAPYRGKGAVHPYLDDGPRMSANPLEWDESPSHQVHITRSFYMASKPVTNKQYEQFDPDHARLRGKRGFSSGDDEAVLFVNDPS